MKLGDQTAPTNDVHLKYLARYGVRNICGYPQIDGDRLYATVDELKRMIDMAAKYGISIDCTAPPFLESSYIDREKHPAIMLAQSPERDRDIEQLQIFIRNCAQAGIPCDQIQHEHSRRAAHRLGSRPRRRALPPVEALRSASRNTAHARRRRSTPMPSGSASPTFSIASSRSPTNTKSAWPAIRRIPACRPRAIRA